MRGRLEVIMDIIEVLNSGQTKASRISAISNVNYIHFVPRLEHLVRKGFATTKPVGKRYKRYYATDKCQEAIKLYDRIIELIYGEVKNNVDVNK